MNALNALCQVVDQLPDEYQEQLSPHIVQLVKSAARQRTTLNKTMEVVSELRLTVK